MASTADSTLSNDDYAQWAIIAARAAADKLAENTVIIDVGDVLGITDLFLITTGSNTRQVRAIANNIEEMVARDGGPHTLRREGHDTFEWVLLDFGGFICHVFEEEHRAYYELERLWGDLPRVNWRQGEPSEK